MEISNHGKRLNPHLPSSANRLPEKTRLDASSNQVDENSRASLADQLKGNSEIRNQLLVQIKAKIEAGHYNTAAAFEQAAQKMLET